MHRGGWWSKRWCMMVLVQDLYLMLQFLGLLPQATAWNSQKISIIMFPVCSKNIFSFVLNMRTMMTTTHWSAKTWCNRKVLPTSLKCLKNGWRNFWIIPTHFVIIGHYYRLQDSELSPSGTRDHWTPVTGSMLQPRCSRNCSTSYNHNQIQSSEAVLHPSSDNLDQSKDIMFKCPWLSNRQW